jgi:hypothetical protein
VSFVLLWRALGAPVLSGTACAAGGVSRSSQAPRRGGRVVECSGLENRRTGNRSVSSNLTHAAVTNRLGFSRATGNRWPFCPVAPNSIQALGSGHTTISGLDRTTLWRQPTFALSDSHFHCCSCSRRAPHSSARAFFPASVILATALYNGLSIVMLVCLVESS